MKIKTVDFWLFLLAVAAVSLMWAYSTSAAFVAGDAQVLGVLAAINQNEIVASELAVEKNVSPEVADFARMMEKEHTANLNDTEALSRRITSSLPAASKVSIEVRDKGEKDLALLMAKDGPAFSAAYVGGMVQGHMEALDAIDKLYKEASNADVKDFLDTTRQHVAMHLKAAEKIQAHLPR